MNLFRRLLTLAFAALPLLAAAQAWPTKPIKLILPLPPGGQTDAVVRYYAQKAEATLGQPFVIENKPGVNTMIGTQEVARAPADGYTLLFNMTAIVSNPVLMPATAKYDALQDFVPIYRAYELYAVFAVPASAPYKTLAEFVAAAKASAQPFTYGTTGHASSSHYFVEMLAKQAKLTMVHVPYKGDSAAVMDVVAGNVDLSFSTVSATLSLIQAGKLRAIAMTGLQRSQSLPDVPTLDETVLKGFNADTWVGLFAPARTPDPIIKRLYEATKVALADPDVAKKLIAGGNNIVGNDTAQFRAFLAAESKKWGEVIRAGNIKLDE